MKQDKCLFVSLLCSLPTLQLVMGIPFGIQSGHSGNEDVGSSYGGAFSYDSSSNVLYITGSTYGSFWSLGAAASATKESSCFFSLLQLPDDVNDGGWLYKERLGTASAIESCSTLVKIDSSKVFLGGQTEEGGLLTPLRNAGGNRATQYGIVVDIDVDLRSAGETSSTNLVGGRLFNANPVQSIKSIAALPLGDSLFVVSQASDLSVFSDDYDATVPEPNLIDTNKYGSDYDLKILKMAVKQSTSDGTTTTLENPAWTKEIATTLNPVTVAGIQVLSTHSALLLAGSAIGSNGQTIITSDTTDTWAGFASLMDAETGEIKSAARIDRAAGRTVRVEGMCKQADQEDAVYLVGSTNGVYELSDYTGDGMTAFMVRLKLPDLSIEWYKQLAAKTGPIPLGPVEMTGRRCAVTDDGKFVYVGGEVKNGHILDFPPAHRSQGQDDIWVGQVDTQSTNWTWTRQLGTSHDESLADLTVDKDGNAVVLGNTGGSFMRQKLSPGTDVFVISMTRATGEYPLVVEESLSPSAGGAVAAPKPSPAVTGPTFAPRPTVPTRGPTPSPHTVAPHFERLPAVPRPETTNSTPQRNGGSSGAIAVAVVISAVGIIMACFIWQRRLNTGKENDEHVLEYLKGFDDVEVDLKHSATGGWHGTYVNHDGGPRFYSDSGMPEETIIFQRSGSEMSPLTHSAIVEDSLFSIDDDDDIPNDFGGSVSSKGRSKSSYRGLVDIYNNTWDDRSQFQLPGVHRPPPRSLVEVDINEDTDEHIGLWGKEII